MEVRNLWGNPTQVKGKRLERLRVGTETSAARIQCSVSLLPAVYNDSGMLQRVPVSVKLGPELSYDGDGG